MTLQLLFIILSFFAMVYSALDTITLYIIN